MDLGITGKIALVAAASRGLGRGCAEQLAAEGCRVAICARDGAAAQQAAADIAVASGGEVVGLGADLNSVADIGRRLKDDCPGACRPIRCKKRLKPNVQ